jgi:hypothetical protein
MPGWKLARHLLLEQGKDGKAKNRLEKEQRMILAGTDWFDPLHMHRSVGESNYMADGSSHL